MSAKKRLKSRVAGRQAAAKTYHQATGKVPPSTNKPLSVRQAAEIIRGQQAAASKPQEPKKVATPKTAQEQVVDSKVQNQQDVVEPKIQNPKPVVEQAAETDTGATTEQVTETKAATEPTQDTPKQTSIDQINLGGLPPEEQESLLLAAYEEACPGDRAVIEQKLKDLKGPSNTAKLGTNESTEEDNPEERKEGEKFKEGDIIKYLYGECFLGALSKGFDYIDSFMLACGQYGGQLLGDSIKNIMDGYKDLKQNYKEDAQIRDFGNASATITQIYSKQARHYQEVRGEQVERLRNAAILGTIISKGATDMFSKGGVSLSSIEKQYEAIKAKKVLSPSDKRKMKILEKIIPPHGESYPEVKYSSARRQDMLLSNIEKMANEFGPELKNLVTPMKGESLKTFQGRFNLQTINTSIDNAVNLCDIQTKTARMAAMKTLVDYSTQLGVEATGDQKTQYLLSRQIQNTKGLNDEIEHNFGDLGRNGITDENKGRIDAYLETVGKASVESARQSSMHLSKNKNLASRAATIDQEISAINSITVPPAKKPEQPRKMPDTPKIGIEGLAKEYNTSSPIEEEYTDITAKLDKQAAKEERKARRKKAKEIIAARRERDAQNKRGNKIVDDFVQKTNRTL